MVPLLVGIVWLGLYPQPVLRRMEPATQRYLQLTQPARAAPPVAVRGVDRRGPAMSRIDLRSPLGLAIALLPEILLSVWALIVLLVVSWRHRTAEDSRLAGLDRPRGTPGERGGTGRAVGERRHAGRAAPDGGPRPVPLRRFGHRAAGGRRAPS